MNNRKHKRMAYAQARTFHAARNWMSDEEYAWEYMAPIGREFGSPDFDRLCKIERIAHRAKIEQCTETGLLVGYVPGIDGVRAFGETPEEVIFNLQTYLEIMSSRYRGRTVRKDPRKKVPENERWLFEGIDAGERYADRRPWDDDPLLRDAVPASDRGTIRVAGQPR